MADDFYGNRQAICVQEKVLADDTISDSAKLAFCRLNCKESFRFGWIVYDRTWTESDNICFRELEAKGYVIIREGKSIGVGLIALDMRKC
ncbi:MAG: hypothetical protein PHW28_09845 [Mesotoga sp.]|nr:hypothetical protein [Mesotoga sp.]